jgi:hypothetical protein
MHHYKNQTLNLKAQLMSTQFNLCRVFLKSIQVSGRRVGDVHTAVDNHSTLPDKLVMLNIPSIAPLSNIREEEAMLAAKTISRNIPDGLFLFPHE